MQACTEVQNAHPFSAPTRNPDEKDSSTIVHLLMDSASISNDTSLGAGVWGPVAVTGLETALLPRLVLDL